MREQFEMISLDELSVLEITCEKCGTIMALKTDGKEYFPAQCPTCTELTNGPSEKLNKALTAYRNFCREMNALKLKARFRMDRTPTTHN